MSWFPRKNDPELERLAGIIFGLRRELFLRDGYSRAQERVWETPEEEARRERHNEEALIAWDNETRKLILGEQS